MEDRGAGAEVADGGQVAGIGLGVADQGGGLKGGRAAGDGHRHREPQRGQAERRQGNRRRRVGPPGLIADRRPLGGGDPGPG